MVEPLRVLTGADVRVLKEALDQQKKGRIVPAKKGQPEPDSPPLSSMMIAYTPGGGIPARSGTTIGKASCLLYRRLLPAGTTLVSTGRSVDVYNLSTDAIPASSYIAVWLDRFGTWWVGGGSGGGGPITGGTGGGGAGLAGYVQDAVYWPGEPGSQQPDPDAFVPDDNKLYAIPFWMRETKTINRFDTYTGTAPVSGDSKIRIGIYTNKASDFYPDARQVDSGEVLLASSGSPLANPVTVTVSLSVTGSQWMWLVMSANAVAGGGQWFRGFRDDTKMATQQIGAMWNGTQYVYFSMWAHAQSYAALPSTFPNTTRLLGWSSGSTAWHPAIGMHFA